MLQPQLREERVRGVLINQLVHDVQLTASAGVNGADQIQHSGLATTRRSTNHNEFTPAHKQTKQIRQKCSIELRCFLKLY